MYTIVMKSDKSLIASHKETIYEKETNVNTIQFLVPQTCDDIELTSCVVAVKYVTPDRKNRCEKLYPQEGLYKNHIDFRLGVDTCITALPGDVLIRLSFLKLVKTEDGGTKEQVLHSGSITISVTPLKFLYGFNSNESLEIVDQLMSEMNAKIEAINIIATDINKSKADDIEIIDGEIWLTAGGEKIGDPIPSCEHDSEWTEL